MRRADVGLNLLLALLAAGSLLLTARLWFEPAGGGLPLQQERARSATAPRGPAAEPPDLVYPSGIWLHPGGGAHTLVTPAEALYRRAMWVTGPALSRLAAPRHEALEKAWDFEVERAFNQGPAISVDLPGALPLGTLARRWQAPLVSSDLETTVERVLIFLGEPPAVYLLGPQGQFRLPAAPEADQDRLLFLLRDVDASKLTPYAPLPRWVEQATPASGVMVPSQQPLMPVLATTVLGPSVTELVPALFADPSVVRQIEERDGAVIYTNGRRALRVFPSGALEYTAPNLHLDGAAPGLERALGVVYEFVANYGGWPAGLAITQFRQEGNRTRLAFQYRAGRWPVLGPRPLLAADLTEEGLLYLYQSIYLPGAPTGAVVAVIAAEKAVAAAVAALGAGDSIRLEEIHLGHFLPAEGASVLVPAWAIGFAGGQTVWVDAASGATLALGR